MHIHLCRLFNAKVILEEEVLWYYSTYSGRDKVVHAFAEGISPKVNVIAQLVLLCCDSAAMKGADRKYVRPVRKILRKK